MKESLEKQGLLLNPDVRAAKEKELQTKFRDFERWGEDVQNELNQKRIELETNISRNLVKLEFLSALLKNHIHPREK
ncbi:MAG: hypothetical protein ACXWMI_07275 [Syntrophales bacterium]